MDDIDGDADAAEDTADTADTEGLCECNCDDCDDDCECECECDCEGEAKPIDDRCKRDAVDEDVEGTEKEEVGDDIAMFICD